MRIALFYAVLGAFTLPSDTAAQADLIGPDGIAYPDWRRAGIPGGIPDVPVVARVADFGAVANDSLDDSEAIVAAINAAAKAGGGAVEFDAGNYVLAQPICITADGIVLRGQGAEHTKVTFTYALAKGEIRFVNPKPGSTVNLDTTIEVHAYPGERDSTYDASAPGQLEKIVILHEGRTVAETKSNEGGPFRCAIPLWRIIRESGPLQLLARATWVGGESAETTLNLHVEASYATEGRRRLTSHEAAITFIGDEWTGRGVHRWLLAEDAVRGTNRLVVQPGGGSFRRPVDLPGVTEATVSPALASVFKPGDPVSMMAQTPEAWKKATGNTRDFMRLNYAYVAAIEGDTLVLDRPLRFDFRVAESARLDVRHPLRRGGVEGIAFEQTYRLWTHAIDFRHTEHCWVRGVIVKKAGRNPVNVEHSAHVEIRDSVFEDGWYQLGGGTSYLGFTMSFDCLAERIVTRRLRHAPTVGWSGAGNVFRESFFEQSDANWHTAWTHENLLERSTVVATKGSGSYGYGIYTSRHRTAHAGTGPRNVFYANEILSPDSAIYLGGAVESPMFLYNRFVVKRGPAIQAEARSDHVVLIGNTFILAEPGAAWLTLIDDAKPRGWRVQYNVVSGGAGLRLPRGVADIERDNRAVPLDAKLKQAAAPVPSIFLWQREHHPLGKSGL